MTDGAIKRAGYPWIEDPEHPLWDEQQADWPKMTATEAWRAAVEHQGKGGHADSLSHPAFDRRYIVNDQATRPADEVAEAAPRQPGREASRR